MLNMVTYVQKDKYGMLSLTCGSKLWVFKFVCLTWNIWEADYESPEADYLVEEGQIYMGVMILGGRKMELERLKQVYGRLSSWRDREGALAKMNIIWKSHMET